MGVDTTATCGCTASCPRCAPLTSTTPHPCGYCRYCHRMGVAHCDLRLESLLLRDSGPMPLLKLAALGALARGQGLAE